MKLNLLLRLFLPPAALILFAVFVFKFSLVKTMDIRKKILIEQKNEKILSQKLSLLTEVGDEDSASSLVVAAALPLQNPALAVISQMKTVAGELGVILREIKVSAAVETESLRRLDIEFEVEGPRIAILDFLKQIETLAPIVVLKEVKLTETGNVAEAKVIAAAFYAPSPDSLPMFTEVVSDLTPEEKNVLDEVLKLRKPQFLNLPPPSPSSEEKLDIFNL